MFEEQFSSDNCPFYTPSMPANYLTQGKGLLSIAFLGSIIDLISEQKCFVNWVKAGKFNLEMLAIPMMASFDIYFTHIQKGTDCSIMCGKD